MIPTLTDRDDQFRYYEREPIHLSHDCIVLLHIFRSNNPLEDIWMTESSQYMESGQARYENSAKQFIKQLEGMWTPAFLMALHTEIERELTAWQPNWRERKNG